MDSCARTDCRGCQSPASASKVKETKLELRRLKCWRPYTPVVAAETRERGGASCLSAQHFDTLCVRLPSLCQSMLLSLGRGGLE